MALEPFFLLIVRLGLGALVSLVTVYELTNGAHLIVVPIIAEHVRMKQIRSGRVLFDLESLPFFPLDVSFVIVMSDLETFVDA